MKPKLLIVTLYGILLMLFGACQTEIEVDLPGYEPKLVVEGYMENGKPAMVILTKSIPYFQHIDYDYIMDQVVIKDAVVLVTSSDGEMERLSFLPYSESPYRYAYRGNIIGKENSRYDLRIEWGGKVYTATTTIPHTFDLDSIGFDRSNEILERHFTTIRLQMTDNPAEDNFYQFFVKLHSKKIQDRLWVTTLPVAFDDATFNGQTFNFEILRANPSIFMLPTMTAAEEKEYFRMYFRPGDTVWVKYGQMDFDSYQFWSTGGNNSALGQNPFTNPTPTISNIHGDNVTGVWCGFASKTVQLIYR